MDQSKLQANIEALRELAHRKGWAIVGEKEIQSGYQMTVADGISRIPIAFFPSGKALIQGKPGELQTELKAWWDARKSTQGQPKAPGTTQSSFIETPSKPTPANFTGIPRIGSDESGKGDYFGPLVIGAVYVDEQTEPQLNALGVRDSKLLTDNRMSTMAAEIKALCPHVVIAVEPERYNGLYQKIGNLNILLARGHALALEAMLEKVSCDLAVIDQFGDESYIRAALKDKGRQIRVEQRTRAEEDTAVAAASILARAEFVQQLEELSRRIGITLPKGASDPAIVNVGHEIVAKYGKNMLAKVAKLHFKTTEQILQR